MQGKKYATESQINERVFIDFHRKTSIACFHLWQFLIQQTTFLIYESPPDQSGRCDNYPFPVYLGWDI